MYTITITSEVQRRQFARLCATVEDIQEVLGCKRSKAAALLAKHRTALIIDKKRGRPYHVMPMFRLTELAMDERISDNRRGNPKFRDPSYQWELATRSRPGRSKA